MSSKTPFFQAFGPLLFGRPARRSLQKLGRLNSLQELYELFGHVLPERLLAPAEKGTNSRERLFSTQVTFWAFAAQILSPGTACREIVRRVEAWWQESAGLQQAPSTSTSAYCQARARLDPATLELIRAELAWSLERNVLAEERSLGGRPVKMVDGTGLSMPDTPENQALWPQPASQKPGCGFPSMKLVGLFSLSSGALLEAATGNLHTHESTLFRTLWSKLQKGDIVLGDRGFCSYAAIAALQAQRGVDSVLRLHQMRKADFRTGRRLGPDDRLVVWQKPMQRTDAWSAEEFAALPETLALRMVRLRVAAKGFRTKSVVLVTTLLDVEAYPAEALRELYGERWGVEMHFAQIKTFLAMDVLRCKSPELIAREVLMHQIAYNLVRSLMQRSAHLHRAPLERLSFKGTLDTLRHWSGLIAAAGRAPAPAGKAHRPDARAHRRRPRPGAARSQRAARKEATVQKLPAPHQAKAPGGQPAASQSPKGQTSQIRLILVPFGPDPVLR
jgi:hypothetical protein